jgi:hypothetical protein
MSRKAQPVTAEQLTKLQDAADEFAHELASVANALEKHLLKEPVSLALISTINRVAEQAAAVNRMLISTAQMQESNRALEGRLEERLRKERDTHDAEVEQPR